MSDDSQRHDETGSKPTNKEDSNEYSLSELKAQQETIRQLILEQRQDNRRKWYLQPGNWIAIIGVIVALIAYLSNIESKQITISYTDPKSLLESAGFVTSNAMIVLGNETLKDIQQVVIAIKNTGNSGVSSDDFKDGPITFTFNDVNPSLCSDDFILNIVESGSFTLTQGVLTRDTTDCSFSYMPPTLNKGEAIFLHVYLRPVDSYDLVIQARILNGAVVVTKEIENPEKISTDIASALKYVFGNNVLGMIIPVLLLLVSIIVLLWHHAECIYWSITDEVLGAIGYFALIVIFSIWTILVYFF